MTDYASWKVTDLKAELKRRGIPQTGLRVKQQIIDRLVEEDSKGQNRETDEAPAEVEEAPAQESQPAEVEAEVEAAPEPEPENEPEREPDMNVPAETEQINQKNHATEDTDATATDVQTEIPKPDEPRVEEAEPTPPPESAQPEEQSRDSPDAQEKDENIKPKGNVPDNEVVTEPTEQDERTVEAKPPGAASDTKQVEPLDQVDQTPTIAQEDTKLADVAEQVAPAGPISGPSTGLSTPLPAEELVEDVRKRKRRSQTPIPNPEEVARKKAKALDSTSSDEKEITIAPSADKTQAQPDESVPEGTAPVGEKQGKKSTPQKQDMRFKGLFSSTGREQTRPSSPPADVEMEDAAVEPALHPATAALYIDGLMRPLQPAALKNHLVSVASPPGSSPNPDLIVDFYLDSIKTHSFARFADVTTAARARNSLHGTVWPNEKNRKSLFVDFIPEEKVQDWIQREEDARGRRGPPPRWEVRYDKNGDEIEAVLEEVDPKNAGAHGTRAPAAKEFTHPPPRGPRAETQAEGRRPSGPSQPSRSSHPGQGFKPLDELFKSTTTKPKLYYLPVSRDVADRRLDRFDELLRKGEFPRRGGDETRKISFEDSDQFIDLGAEFAGRGRGGGRGRGRGGGMVNSRRGSRRDRY
ncbi:hypothetical protein BJY04DRAFT_233335 [Aspergillus karnatakaensis]|uniref:SAP domain protein n=1 Tax=Aspergillus karnatakaensis TaxID=1810916 RepID=UPI003CCCF482